MELVLEPSKAQLQALLEIPNITSEPMLPPAQKLLMAKKGVYNLTGEYRSWRKREDLDGPEFRGVPSCNL